MKTSDFSFELPPELIAQNPPAERGQSRLMVMNRSSGSIEHRMVNQLPSILKSGTLMVFNDSRVRKARLLGVSETTGAKVEFLLVDTVPVDTVPGNTAADTGDGTTGSNGTVNPIANASQHGTVNRHATASQFWRVMVQRSRRRRSGSRYLIGDPDSKDKIGAEITGEDGEFRILKFERPIDDAWLDKNGHVPLPPYIRRQDKSEDSERYQTVYAREYGSAAAPTAGLHFTNELLAELERAGIEIAYITLHVGLGTFLPVRTDNVEDHAMHREVYSIDDATGCRIEKARAEGRTVLAVGTTSVRTLESAWIEDPSLPVRESRESSPAKKAGGTIRRGAGSTSIFIYPGYTFKVVDALFTNFHTPESTLLMLVSAFAGKDFILQSYREAIREGYRFFSYGDACLMV